MCLRLRVWFVVCLRACFILFVGLFICVFGSSVYWLFVCELICMCLRLRVWFDCLVSSAASI